jgi:formylglycine-generating enzyme required for sulfatase activity
MVTDAIVMPNQMLNQIEPQIQRQREIAQRQVDRFEQRYGEAMLEFACHAAFPLTLTTDVVYLLRQEYFVGLDWSVAAELLLSNLCDAVGYDLYAMGVAVRRVLLDRLVEDFGSERVDELAGWMARYIQHRLKIEPLGRAKVLGHPSHWTALACLKSDDEVTRSIKVELGRLLVESDDPSERFRLSDLIQSQGDLLAQRGIEPVKLKDLVQRFDRGQPLDGDLDGVNQVKSALQAAGFPELKAAQIKYAKITFEAKSQDEESLRPFSFETVTVDRTGKEIAKFQCEAQAYTETLPEGLNLEMVAIPSGKFMMGSPQSEHERYKDEGPQHEVIVPPFFMGKYAVTQAQWRIVAGLPQVDRELKADPANFKGDNLPVEQVSWLDAEEFCLRLSAATGRTYQLPSEAQWEYACRAGTTTPFYFGETITGKIANYSSDTVYREEKKEKSRGKTIAVGSFPPNQFGLYDMHGNVWEWCMDDWHGNYDGAPNDGIAWVKNAESQSSKVIRGGSWNYNPWACRSASRGSFTRDYRNGVIGFRLVCCAPSSLV